MSTQLPEIETSALPSCGRLTATERDALVRQWLPLAYKLAAKHRRRRGGSADDLCQEAALALVEAATTYSPDRGVKFCNYAARCIMNHLINVSEKGAADVLDHDPLRLHGENALDVIAPEPVAPTEPDEMQKLLAAIAALPAPQQLVIRRRRIEGATRRQVAAELGCTCARLRTVEKRALLALAEAMGADPAKVQMGREPKHFKSKARRPGRQTFKLATRPVEG